MVRDASFLSAKEVAMATSSLLLLNLLATVELLTC